MFALLICSLPPICSAAPSIFQTRSCISSIFSSFLFEEEVQTEFATMQRGGRCGRESIRQVTTMPNPIPRGTDSCGIFGCPWLRQRKLSDFSGSVWFSSHCAPVTKDQHASQSLPAARHLISPSPNYTTLPHSCWSSMAVSGKFRF